MKTETMQKINGVGAILRFVTPLMVGVMLAMMTRFLGQMDTMNVALNNHLQHDMTEIKERLAVIETKIGVKAP